MSSVAITVYLTPQEFVARIGEAKALQLVNEVEDNGNDPTDGTMLATAVEDANSIVASYVRKRYNRTIISPVPPVLKRRVTDIAKWLLVSGPRIDVESDPDKDAHDNAIEWCEALVKAELDLPIEDLVDERGPVIVPRVTGLGSGVTARQDPDAPYKQPWWRRF